MAGSEAFRCDAQEFQVNYAATRKGQLVIGVVMAISFVLYVAFLVTALVLANGIGQTEPSKQNAVRVAGAIGVVFALGGLGTGLAMAAFSSMSREASAPEPVIAPVVEQPIVEKVE